MPSYGNCIKWTNRRIPAKETDCHMKILEINTEKTWRGGERQTLYTIKGLKEAGINVELLCLRGYPLFEKSKVLNIPIHGVKNQNEAIKFLSQNGKTFDIIHAQTAKGQSIAVLSKVFHKRPVIYTRRVDFVPKGNLSRFKYKLTDRVIAISNPIREILEKFGVNNTEVIPSIAERKDLNIERGETLKHELGLTKQKIVATIAALVPHKDPMTMVETIKELSGLRNDFVFLHFGDGHLNREVMKKLKQYNLEDVYKLMGFYENVEDFFSIFDVFVMGSHEEGLGSSVLDAFLYRVPVVSTDAGGLKEAVSGRGLLCPVKYPKCLAESINTIIENKVLREKFIIKAFNDVNEYYSMKRNIEEYIKIFNSLLK